MIKRLEELKATAPKPVIDQFVKSVHAYIDQQGEAKRTQLLAKLEEVLKPTTSRIDENAVIISESLQRALEGIPEEANTAPLTYNKRGKVLRAK